MPDLHRTVGLPTKEVIHPTKVQPFQHQVNTRHNPDADLFPRNLTRNRMHMELSGQVIQDYRE